MTYVTCPTMRYHPAVVAQKAATLQMLADGRFTLGLGSGENLNEHVVGEGWPAVATRQDDARRGDRDHPRAAHRRAGRPTRASTSTSTRRGSGTCPTSRSSIAVAVSGDAGDRAVRAARRPPHRGRARGRARRRVERRRRRPADRRRRARDRPDPDLLGPRRRRRGRARPRAVPLVRRRLDGQRRPADPGGLRGREPVRAARGRRRRRSRAAPTSTRSSRRSRAYWEAGFTDVALVQVGDERQERFLDQAAGPLLEKLRAAST